MRARLSHSCALLPACCALSSSRMGGLDYGTVSGEAVRVSWPTDGVLSVELHRPTKMNAFNGSMWTEIREVFRMVAGDTAVRCVVISAAGKNFTAGLDLAAVGGGGKGEPDVGRKAYAMREHVLEIQDSFNAIEECGRPVIGCAHGACIGAGIDLLCACDIRYCSADTKFCVKEVDVGLAADVGTLQRLPKIVGNDSTVRELAYTARMFFAEEAQQMGLMGKVFADVPTMAEAALQLASLIASKSPIAVSGTKRNLIYARDHTVAEGLEYVATWNAAMLQTEDMLVAMKAFMTKDPAGPKYRPLGPPAKL